ncbi:MAG TPA: acyl-CoA dehydrogenase family protein [Syntrophomonas sp.]|nr:acyl-CoA dehydrogenase family protein [Syntrophomonas sp.]
MDFRLTDEQKMIRDMARDFTENEIIPNAAQWDRDGEFPWETVNKMFDVGIMNIGIPAEYGGEGVDHVSQNLVLEEIARGDAGIATTLCGNALLAPDPVLIAATDEQKKWWYGRQLERAIPAICITEPGAGSDVVAMSTKCQKVGDEYIINGNKQFITNGGLGGLYTLFATTDKSLGHKGICAFMIDAKTPGITVGKEEDKLGIRSSNTVSLNFEDVRVPAKNLLGKEGEGFKICMQTFDISRACVAAMAIGLSQAAFEAAAKYACERKQFGAPIIKIQAVGFMLADMAMNIEAGRLLYLSAASKQDLHIPYTEAASLAKAFCGDNAQKITADAVQVFGGYGFTKDYPVEKYYRDSKIMQLYEGTSQVQRVVIANNIAREFSK